MHCNAVVFLNLDFPGWKLTTSLTLYPLELYNKIGGISDNRMMTGAVVSEVRLSETTSSPEKKFFFILLIFYDWMNYLIYRRTMFIFII